MKDNRTMPRRYNIYREKSIGRRLFRPEGSPIDQPCNNDSKSEIDLEEVRLQLREVYDCFSSMLSGPLAANGKIMVDRCDLKHMFKSLGVLELELNFMTDRERRFL